MEGAEHYLDMSRVPEDADLRGAAQAHAVFGRVTPQQKRALICALKAVSYTHLDVYKRQALAARTG